MNTELKNAVLSTDIKAQYDECVKKLLKGKDIDVIAEEVAVIEKVIAELEQ